ncbi:hypothetical protein [Halosegnis longus]|uniref:hypothetical protein n=1 Tax=Halosegnis longus TaxID=2216012 RepID=UPI00129DBD8D|nr:hypothetical protein [Halosegnis longus]
MTTLQSLLARTDANAAVAWVLTGGLLGAVGQFWRIGELDWAVVTMLLVGVTITIPIVARTPTVMLPAELLAAAAVPVAVRATGMLPQVTPFVAVAALGVLTVVVLDATTSLSMTPRFAAVFVVVVTMAGAGVWTVGTWVADTIVGTMFVGGKTELMWDLIIATVVGVGAGLLFDGYVVVSDRIEHLRTATGHTGTASTSTGGSLPGSTQQQRRVVRLLQLLLVGITIVALARRNVTLVVNSGVPLAITFLPAVLRREFDYTMDPGLVVWITLATVLHAVGAVALYELYGWYDSLTHTFSASLIAGGGYAIARSVEHHTQAVSFTRGFRGSFVVLFVLAVGVAWEILEFASGGVATLVGGEAVLAQYGTTDIVNDLVFNAAGAVVVATLGSAHFEGIAAWLASRVDVLVRGGS